MSFTRTGILPVADECYCSNITSTAFEGVQKVVCPRHAIITEIRAKVEGMYTTSLPTPDNDITMAKYIAHDQCLDDVLALLREMGE